MVTAVVLSKDRPAQLDLLLQSLERNGGGQFAREINRRVAGAGFERLTRALIDGSDDFVCFMCDDGILYRPVPAVGPILYRRPDVLTLSLRLGANTTVCYPSGLTQAVPKMDADCTWDWTAEPRQPGVSDFGYPGSVDGHIFRVDDVQRMLDGRSFPNPTALECALAAGCDELAAERPLMACYPQSVYVGNPVNRVSDQSNVRFGDRFPVTAEECAARFAAGERIDLDALDFTQVDGAHTEIELVWR